MGTNRIGEGFKRHFGALDAQNEDGFFEANQYVEFYNAPATGEVTRLGAGPLVPKNLTITRTSDSFTYTRDTHFLEDVGGAFENVSITEGTSLRVEYWATGTAGVGTTPGDALEDPTTLTPEAGYTVDGGCTPTIYRDRGRAYLAGRITHVSGAGASAEIFALTGAYTPGCDARLPAAAVGGVTFIEVQTDGSVNLGETLGAGWLSLEGLSWRISAATPLGAFTSWGQTDILFGGLEMDVDYSELS